MKTLKTLLVIIICTTAITQAVASLSITGEDVAGEDVTGEDVAGEDVAGEVLTTEPFSTLVGLSCEKPTMQTPYEDLDNVVDCLLEQVDLIHKEWEKLKAKNKVLATPELMAKVREIVNKAGETDDYYIKYHTDLPEEMTQAQWDDWHKNYVEWLNIAHGYCQQIIGLFNSAIIAPEAITPPLPEAITPPHPPIKQAPMESVTQPWHHILAHKKHSPF